MINVSRVLSSPSFAQTFGLIRPTGAFANEGQYTQTSPEPVSMVGVIQPASQQDMVQFGSEGERQGSMIVVYCAQEIRVSDGVGVESDIIVWHGTQYRACKPFPWHANGYWKVLAEAIGNA